MNAEDLRNEFSKGIQGLTDRQVAFLAVLTYTVSETIKSAVEIELAEIKAELREIRRGVAQWRK